MTTTTTPVSALAGTPTRSESGFRTAAAAGIAFVILDVVGTFLPGAPPASDASTAKTAAYFHDHSGAIKAQLLIGALGIMALLWWFGALWRMLSRLEAERPRLAAVAAAALVSGVVLAIMSSTITAGAAMHLGNAETTRLLFGFSLVTAAIAGLGVSLFLFAACAVLYRSDTVPRWSNYAGWIAALAFLVGGLSAVSDANALNLLGIVAFLAWCVWIVVISVSMWRSEVQ
jgi:hypothetical protein